MSKIYKWGVKFQIDIIIGIYGLDFEVILNFLNLCALISKTVIESNTNVPVNISAEAKYERTGKSYVRAYTVPYIFRKYQYVMCL